MQILNKSHLSYCTNIHPGERWEEIFNNLKTNLIEVKAKVAPTQSFGIGLRLSNQASLDIIQGSQLNAFKDWLQASNCYVFTMNGFPYGGFHDQVIKDKVHAPDWTTQERLDYTKRLADILADILPKGMTGGISTSPISYRWWYPSSDHPRIKQKATGILLDLVEHLYQIKERTGHSIHIDMEPEPDGLLETGQEFIDFYRDYLLGDPLQQLIDKLKISREKAEELVREHIQLCFDVCHYAVEYDDSEKILEQHRQLNIPIGKIQISAAMKADLGIPEDRQLIRKDLNHFVEPNYLHQAVLRTTSGELRRYKDLDIALEELSSEEIQEVRTHFHVPIFAESYGNLKSTQEEIILLLKLWRNDPFCQHLEIETYTWNVLPEGLKKDLNTSIVREIEWVVNELDR